MGDAADGAVDVPMADAPNDADDADDADAQVHASCGLARWLCGEGLSARTLRVRAGDGRPSLLGAPGSGRAALLSRGARGARARVAAAGEVVWLRGVRSRVRCVPPVAPVLHVVARA